MDMFLADRLIADGVEVIFDRYDLKLGSNNNYFMEKIETADKVSLIMTPDYKIKADNRTSGIGYEYQIISSEFSKNISLNHKFIPILKEGTKELSIPLFLQSFLFLNMANDSEFEEKYIELLKNIYNEPLLKKPLFSKYKIWRNFSNWNSFVFRHYRLFNNCSSGRSLMR